MNGKGVLARFLFNELKAVFVVLYRVSADLQGIAVFRDRLVYDAIEGIISKVDD